MRTNRDWPRVLVVLWLALAVAYLALAVAYTWGGNYTAGLAYGTATIAAACTAAVADRWATWRDLATGRARWAGIIGVSMGTLDDGGDEAERIERENRQGDGDPL